MIAVSRRLTFAGALAAVVVVAGAQEAGPVAPATSGPSAVGEYDPKMLDAIIKRATEDRKKRDEKDAQLRALSRQPEHTIRDVFDQSQAADKLMAEKLREAAKVDLPKPPPFLLPAFDGKERTHDTPTARPATPDQPDARLLYDMAVACWPGPSAFRLELTAQAGVKQRQQSSQSNTFNPNTGSFDVGAAGRGQDSYIGVVAAIPIYSATEVDRERQRERQRRDDAAKAVGVLVEAIAQLEVIIHQVRLYRAVERRAQERVTLGVADTSEQLGVVVRLADLEGAGLKYRAQITTARLNLISACAEDRADLVDAYIRKFSAGVGLGE